MLKRIFIFVVGSFSVALILLWSAPAWTCTVVPTASFQLDGEVVPSTVPGALYRSCQFFFDDEDPEFSLSVDDTDELVAISVEHYRHGIYEVAFEEELEPETTYRFEAEPECAAAEGESVGSWTFETDQPAELPELIGVWIPHDVVQGMVQIKEGASCSGEVEAAYAEFEFETHEDAVDWEPVLAFETYVDFEIWEPRLSVGQSFVGRSRLGWGEERVYAVCEDEPYRPGDQPHAETLSEGVNRAQISAFLPGTELVWTTERETLLLNCETAEEDNEEDNGADEEDNGADEEGPLEEEGPNDEESNGCAQVSGGTGGAAAMVVFLVLGMLRRFRLSGKHKT